jgi:hypothetical protein
VAKIDTSFNFGFNVKPKKKKAPKKRKRVGKKGNAWTAYVTGQGKR